MSESHPVSVETLWRFPPQPSSNKKPPFWVNRVNRGQMGNLDFCFHLTVVKEHLPSPASAVSEDWNQQRDALYFWVGRLNIEKEPILSKWMCVFHVIPLKIPARDFTDADKTYTIYTARQRTPSWYNSLQKRRRKQKKSLSLILSLLI